MGDAHNNRTTTHQHTERQHMKNLAAPIVVFTIGSIGFITVNEPGGILLMLAIAIMGYGINKAAN